MFGPCCAEGVHCAEGGIRLSLLISHAHVVNRGSTTFHVLIMWQQRGIATLTTRARYLGSSVLTTLCLRGLPVSSLIGMRESGHRTPGPNTLRIRVAVGTNVEPGRGRDTRWLWISFQEERGEGEQPPFLLTPSRTNVADVVDLATIHAHAIGHLVRCECYCSIYCLLLYWTDKFNFCVGWRNSTC